MINVKFILNLWRFIVKIVKSYFVITVLATNIRIIKLKMQIKLFLTLKIKEHKH
jgi:hypothetical protein